MGVLSAYKDEGVGDQGQIAEQPVPATGFMENLHAGYQAQQAGPGFARVHQNEWESPYYDQIIKSLAARGVTTTDDIPGIGPSRPRPFRNPLSGTAPLYAADQPLAWSQKEGQNLWSEVQKIRAKDPSFLKDLPDAQAITSRAFADRKPVIAQAQGVNANASTLGQAGWFIGSLAGGWDNPSNLVGAGGGSGGKIVAKELLKGAAKEGAFNVVGGLLSEPFAEGDRQGLGIETTPGEVATNAAYNFAFGAGMHLALPAAKALTIPVGKAAAKAVDAGLSHLPEPIRNAAIAASVRAGTIDDRALTMETSKALAPYSVHDIATPDEKASLHVVTRDADIREASPFVSGSLADNAHENRLGRAMQVLDVGHVPMAVPTPAPLPRVGSGDHANVVDRIMGVEGTKRNQASTAEGGGQFLRGTWLSLYRSHFGGEGLSDEAVLALRNNPSISRQMTELYVGKNAAALRTAGLEDSSGNLYLSHFLGAGGAKALLRAAPDTPVSLLLKAEAITANKSVLEGKSAAEVIGWAHKKMGDASGMPVARADGVYDASSDLVPQGMPDFGTGRFRPDELEADAGLMQYKGGGDLSGVTDRLAGVTEWNPILSGKAVVWEGLDGRKIIVDGHQRLGLAKRLSENNPNIYLDATLLREADGVTPQQARVWGALKNIAEGSGEAVDAARVLRDAPEGFQLPPRSPLVRTAKGLAGLSNEAFGAVLNDVISPEMAAQIGRILPDQPEFHMAMVSLLREAGVTTAGQADSVIRQAAADGFGQADAKQLGMFGELDNQQSLYGPSARILEAAKRQLRSEKRSFKVLTEDAGRIEAAGNKLDRTANKAKVIGNDEALAILDATAHSSGPVRTALLDAARTSLTGDIRGSTRQFLDALGGIDLHAAARGMGESVGGGLASGGAGRALDAAEADAELASGRGLSGGPSAYDEAVAAGQSGLGFSDPIGASAKSQTASLEHDLLMDLGVERVDPAIAEGDKQKVALASASPLQAKAEQEGTMGLAMFDAADQPTFRLSEDGGEWTFADILNDTERDLNAVEAARACMAPPKAAS